MMIAHAIGPTFGAELHAAGLGDGVLWTPLGVIVADDYDPDQLTKLGAVIAAHDASKPPPTVTVIPKLDLWRAMTDAEHAQMTAGVAQQSPRIQDIFNACDTFRSDAPEWPLLQQMAVTLYGADRAAQLLTPPKGA